MPPYEWYNKKVVEIAAQLNQKTINFSSGTRSNADYTTPDMPNYISSDDILKSIYNYVCLKNMNGFHLLIHPGTNPKRTDKFYFLLDELISKLKNEGYHFAKF
jgi:peptidoglycan/xylan/chitin deacetylase (PgdA/CDA1 family)